METEFEVVLEKFAKIFRDNNIQFVVIGAVVPALLIDEKEIDGHGFGIRKTHDVDCTVKVKNDEFIEMIDVFKSGMTD